VLSPAFAEDDYPPKAIKELEVYRETDPKGSQEGPVVVVEQGMDDRRLRPQLLELKTVRTERIYSKTSPGEIKLNLTPMLGGTFYAKESYTSLQNSYTLALVVGVPVEEQWNVEIEGVVSENRLQRYYGSGYATTEYGMGSNIQFNPLKGIFRPYLGSGLMGLYSNEEAWVPAWQGNLGSDVFVSDSVGLGLRGSYVVPVLADHSSFYRLLGTIALRI
jgi:hypothetical protein